MVAIKKLFKFFNFPNGTRGRLRIGAMLSQTVADIGTTTTRKNNGKRKKAQTTLREEKKASSIPTTTIIFVEREEEEDEATEVGEPRIIRANLSWLSLGSVVSFLSFFVRK